MKKALFGALVLGALGGAAYCGWAAANDVKRSQVTLLEEGPEEQRASRAAAPSEAPVLNRAAGPGIDSERVDELEERLRAMETARRAPAEAAPGGPALALSPEESKARHTEAHEQALRAHAAQPVDSTWAPRAVTAFRADLENARERLAANVVDVDCRTTTCVAKLAWKTYDDARKHFSAALHANYAVNCASEITLPEPNDMTAPYEASVIFDCREARAQ